MDYTETFCVPMAIGSHASPFGEIVIGKDYCPGHDIPERYDVSSFVVLLSGVWFQTQEHSDWVWDLYCRKYFYSGEDQVDFVVMQDGQVLILVNGSYDYAHLPPAKGFSIIRKLKRIFKEFLGSKPTHLQLYAVPYGNDGLEDYRVKVFSSVGFNSSSEDKQKMVFEGTDC
jgi:hypothetical protein